METIKNERVIMVDVDGTLIDELRDGLDQQDTVTITDPLRLGRFLQFAINKAMVRLVKEEHHRGSYVVVWSKGGYEWASIIVTALGLTQHVHKVMTKPTAYFDDKPVTEWLTDRVFLDSNTKYKGGQ